MYHFDKATQVTSLISHRNWFPFQLLEVVKISHPNYEDAYELLISEV